MPGRGEIPSQSKEVIHRCLGSVAWIELVDNTSKRYAASGVCIDQSGIILTADHLFYGVEEISSLVVYMNGRRLITPLSVERYGNLDLAMIRLQRLKGLPFSRLFGKDLPEGKASPVTVVENEIRGNSLSQVVMPGVAIPTESMRITDPNYPGMTANDMYTFAFGSSRDNARMIRPGLSGAPLFNPEGLIVGLVKGQNVGMDWDASFNPELSIRGYAIRSRSILREMEG